MKMHLAVALTAAVVALGACGKKNDVPILQHEASMLAQHYQKQLDGLDERIQAIMKRGETIPADFPGVKEVGQELQEARDQTVKLRGIVGTKGQKSPVEIQADAAAKDGKLLELQKLVHETEEALVHGMTLINTDLNAVETWIYQYDNKTLAMNAPAAAEQPGQAVPVNTPATDQPPPAAQQGSAQAPAAEPPKPPTEQAKPPAPKQPTAKQPAPPASKP